MPDLNPYLLRIKEFLEAVPTEQGKKVDWHEVMERKEAAQMALLALSKTVKGSEPKTDESFHT
jgi:hypothetical protein